MPDNHPQQPLSAVLDPDQIYVAQAYQQLAHARTDQQLLGILLTRILFLEIRSNGGS